MVMATSDANGNYTISGVGPGFYKVSEVLQSGFTQTKGGQGRGGPYVFTASSGVNVSGDDFGNFTQASTSLASGVFHVTDGGITGSDITGKSTDAFPGGLLLNDVATVSGGVAGLPMTGTVTYKFFTNETGSGNPALVQTVPVGAASPPQELRRFLLLHRDVQW